MCGTKQQQNSEILWEGRNITFPWSCKMGVLVVLVTNEYSLFSMGKTREKEAQSWGAKGRLAEEMHTYLHNGFPSANVKMTIIIFY